MPSDPECSINFKRRFSIPFGIAPETLDLSKISLYLESLKVGLENRKNTYDKFTHGFPSKSKFWEVEIAGEAKKILTPDNIDPASSNISEQTISQTQAGTVTQTTFSSKAIPAGLSIQEVALEIQKKIHFDSVSKVLSRLPQPFTELDTLRAFWNKNSASSFTDVLGLNLSGVLPSGGLFPPNLPEFLLETYLTSLEKKTGEVNRFVVRSPVSGLVRFEPYYHFHLEGGTLKTICQSNSGRLVIQSQKNKFKSDRSRTKLYDAQNFVIENIDRNSVANHLFLLFAFQFSHFENILNENKTSSGSGNPEFERLKFESPKNWLKELKSSVKRALRAWIIFIGTFNAEPDDQIIFDSIPADKKQKIRKGTLKDDELIEAVNDIINDANRLSNFIIFLEKYYIPVLAGVSWYEVFDKHGLHGRGLEFPVPVDKPPKNGSDREAQRDHGFLESLQNKTLNWLVCYSGCPLGFPSKVFNPSPIPEDQTEFPGNAITTFELEALHLANRTPDIFPSLGGLDTLAGTIPTSGVPIDLSIYESLNVGFSCDFRLRRRSLYSLVDWFQELTKELNTFRKEPEIVSFEKYFDYASADQRHPLATLLKYDDYVRSKLIRHQMDEHEATTFESDNLSWWKSIRSPFIPTFGDWPDGSGDAPQKPFLDDRTRRPPLVSGVASFADGHISSGFDFFDLESMYIARSRVKNFLTGDFDIPMSTIMALAEREGIRLFAWLNRIVNSNRWVAFDGAFSLAGVNTKDLGRIFWLNWPHGLDVYNGSSIAGANSKFDSVIALLVANDVISLETGEEVRKYITERVNSVVPAPVSTPEIFKITRRCHWAFLVLMVGYFQYIHKFVRNKTNAPGTPQFAHTEDDWFIDHFSQDQDGYNALSPERKNFITYYSLVYMGYNSSPTAWSRMIEDVEDTPPADLGGLSLRDYLMFKYEPDSSGDDDNITHVIRYAISLDAYSRIDFLEDNLESFELDESNLADRNWGI